MRYTFNDLEKALKNNSGFVIKASKDYFKIMDILTNLQKAQTCIKTINTLTLNGVWNEELYIINSLLNDMTRYYKNVELSNNN